MEKIFNKPIFAQTTYFSFEIMQYGWWKKKKKKSALVRIGKLNFKKVMFFPVEIFLFYKKKKKSCFIFLETFQFSGTKSFKLLEFWDFRFLGDSICHFFFVLLVSNKTDLKNFNEFVELKVKTSFLPFQVSS